MLSTKKKSLKKIDISVVVPAHNEEALLPLCLKSLIGQNFHGKYEIILVDNHSKDMTNKIAKSFSVKVLYEPKKGIAFARQRGFKESKGKIIASTDADTIVPPNWLEKIYQILKNNPRAVGVTGNIDYHGRTKKRLAIFNILSPIFRKITWLSSGKSHFWGANFAIRQNVFKKIGGFDTRLALGEDHDLGAHAREFGEIIFQKDLRVITSARRFEDKFRTKNVSKLFNMYLVNFFWFLFFKKPKVNKFSDIRTSHKPRLLSTNTLKTIRWTAYTLTLIFFLALIFTHGIFFPNSQVFGKVYWHGNAQEKTIALTFDDGPNEPYTSEILEILDKYHIKATFFIVGENARYYSETIKRIFDNGHVIANHSYSHQDDLAIENIQTINKEITWTQNVLDEIIGKKPHLFRPPHGYKSPWLMDRIKKDNLIAVSWSDMTNDWKQPGVDKITNAIVNKAKPGGIIVLHDGDKSLHGSNRSQEVAALPKIIDLLQQKGYKFVLVSDLLKVPAYNN